MAEPIVTITNVELIKLSDELGFQNADITFRFDTDVYAYTVRCLGNSFANGVDCQSEVKDVVSQATVNSVASARATNVRDFTSFPANTEITAEIDYTELYQEGNNQINIYGKSFDGIWSSYQQG
jgi:hypothetical protein